MVGRRSLFVAVLLALSPLLRAGELPAEYAAVFWPETQPEAWRQPDFYTGSGPAAAPHAPFSFDPAAAPAFRGTWWPEVDDAGEGVGTWVSQWFHPPSDHLLIPVLGKLPDQAIVLESESGTLLTSEETWRVDQSPEIPRFLRFAWDEPQRSQR